MPASTIERPAARPTEPCSTRWIRRPVRTIGGVHVPAAGPWEIGSGQRLGLAARGLRTRELPARVALRDTDRRRRPAGLVARLHHARARHDGLCWLLHSGDPAPVGRLVAGRRHDDDRQRLPPGVIAAPLQRRLPPAGTAAVSLAHHSGHRRPARAGRRRRAAGGPAG